MEIYGNLWKFQWKCRETPFFVEVLGEFITIFVEVFFEKSSVVVILVK